ncbi:MAG: hypothetical protein JNM56_38535 [Planctomycetia bacterium]|nr:hypothetical protein [Planctomycetia bacterium]
MSTTRRFAPRNGDPLTEWLPARTPGTLGRWDAADGEVLGLAGDRPGSADGPPEPEVRSPQGLRTLRGLYRDRSLSLEDLNRQHARQAGWEAHFDHLGTFLGQTEATPDLTSFVRGLARWHWLQGTPAAPPVLDGVAWARLQLLLGVPTSASASSPGSLAGFSAAEERALRITSTLETGQELNFGAAVGNAGQQGLGLGVLLWNLGTGSLQPLLREFAAQHPARLDAALGTGAAPFRAMLNQSHAEQLEFARSLSNSAGQLLPPWNGQLAALANDVGFREIQLRTLRGRMDVAVRQARELFFQSERGLVMLFDVITQHGEGWRKRANRGQRFHDQTADRELLERERLLELADLLADTSPDRYQEEVRARRRTIALGVGTIHGRAFNLPRDFGMTDFPFE